MKNKKLSFKISARPSYVPEQSDPVHQKFVWAYEITIKNDSDQIVQLLHRYWVITDTTGKVEDIHGSGVVGLQPIIKPGKEFTYTSFCQLSTPQGTMEGRYLMQTIDEEQFEIKIPKFILSAPSSITKTFRSRLH